MKQKHCFEGIFFLLVVSLGLSLFGEQTYFVREGGNNNADGLSSETALATIDEGLSRAVAFRAANPAERVTIDIGEGTFVQSTAIALAAGVDLKGAGADKSILDFGTKPNTASAITMNADINSVVSGLTVSNSTVSSSVNGGLILLSKGTVSGCRLTMGTSSKAGGGVYMTGGTVTNCVVDNCRAAGMYTKGGGFYATSGTVVDCRIRSNYADWYTTGGGHGGGIYLSGATVKHCRIYDNGNPNKDGPGTAVALYSGTLENCLVYRNHADKSGTLRSNSNPSIVYQKGGTMQFCTIAGNEVVVSKGLDLAAGTCRNNIIWGNGTSSTAGDVTVASGTFEHNVLEKEIAGYDNAVGDPLFVDLEDEDFHLSARTSAAFGAAVQPATPVTVDFELRARANPPAAGALEYDASGEAFEVEIKVHDEKSLKDKVPAKAEALISGAEVAECSIQWYLDGEEAGTQAIQTFLPTDYGKHTLRLVVTKGEAVKEVTAVDAIAVVGSKAYVGGSDSPAFPYATEGTAAPDLKTAYEAVWKTANVTSEICVAEGSYPVGEQLTIASPMVLSGVGMFKSSVTGNGLVLNHADVCVKDLAIADVAGASGVELRKGVLSACMVTNCYSSKGGGVKVEDGCVVSGCRIVDCRVTGPYTNGGGIYMTGGEVSNCLVVACKSNDTSSRANSTGGGVWMNNGTLVNSIVRDCGSANASQGQIDAALHQEGGTVRGCLFVDNKCPKPALAPAVYVKSGTFESCTISWNEAGEAGLEVAGGTIRNSIIFGNEAPAQVAGSVSVPTYCCFPEADPEANGNRNDDPLLWRKPNGQVALRASSPVIDKGLKIDSWMGPGALDLYAVQRIWGSGPDMGCAEKIVMGLVIQLW